MRRLDGRDGRAARRGRNLLFRRSRKCGNGSKNGNRRYDSVKPHFTAWRVALTSIFQSAEESLAATAAARTSFFEKA